MCSFFFDSSICWAVTGLQSKVNGHNMSRTIQSVQLRIMSGNLTALWDYLLHLLCTRSSSCSCSRCPHWICSATVLRACSPKLTARSYAHKSDDASGRFKANKLWVKQPSNIAVLFEVQAYLFHYIDWDRRLKNGNETFSVEKTLNLNPLTLTCLHSSLHLSGLSGSMVQLVGHTGTFQLGCFSKSLITDSTVIHTQRQIYQLPSPHLPNSLTF